MATISENLQTIKDSTDAIKQAIIDKGGTIEGDITTWADAISGISGGGSSSTDEEYVFSGTLNYSGTTVFITGNLNKAPEVLDEGVNRLLALGWFGGGLCYGFSDDNYTIGPYTLTVDFNEPLIGNEIPAICILKYNYTTHKYTIIPVKFQEDISTNPA